MISSISLNGKHGPPQNVQQAWEDMGEATETADEYGLGQREGLQDALETVVSILGMKPCEASDIVPPNARSHTALLAGHVIGGVAALARVSFGIDMQRNVAMKVVVRAETADVSAAIHEIIQSA